MVIKSKENASGLGMNIKLHVLYVIDTQEFKLKRPVYTITNFIFWHISVTVEN